MTRLPHLPANVLEIILRHSDEPTRDRAMLASKDMKTLTDRARHQDYAEAARRPGRYTSEPLPTYEDLVKRNCAKPNRAHIAKALLPGLPAGETAGPLAQSYSRASGLAEAKLGGFTHSERTREGEQYEGGFSNGKYNGYGAQTRARGEQYEGGFKDGKFHGQGTLSFRSGDFFEGGFKNGQLHGAGIFSWNHGKRYEGGFQDGQLHGQGVLSWTDGARYEGGFHLGQYHGHGTKLWSDGTSYTGEYRNSKAHGQGVKAWGDGERYEGGFKNDGFHGHGTLTKANGEHYTGDFVNDGYHGVGAWTSPEGKQYRGLFKDGKFDGRGIKNWPDGARYEGMFKAGTAEGYGVHRGADGKTYTGFFVGDKPHGPGVMSQPDGSRYEGDFKDGLYEGQGVLTHADGTLSEGQWKEGVLQPAVVATAAHERQETSPEASSSEASSDTFSSAASWTDVGSDSPVAADRVPELQNATVIPSHATEVRVSTENSGRTTQSQDASTTRTSREPARRSFLSRTMGQLRSLSLKSKPIDRSTQARLMRLPARKVSDAELDDRDCPLSLDKLQDIADEAVFWRRGNVLVGAHADEFFQWWDDKKTDPETTSPLPAKNLFRRKS